MLLGVVAQAQNFAITATTEAAVRKNIVKGNAANFGFGMINDTLKLIGLTTRNVIFTGTIGKSGVGLGNVDNTSDANKPVSTATQTALNLKANIASPTFTGTLTAPTIANSLGANFATSSGFVGINTTTNQGYKFDVNGTLRTTNDAYFATTSGKVGVGTTAPQNLLHIKGTATVGLGVRNSHFIIESTETAGVDVGAVLKFVGQSGNTVNPYSFATIEAKKESAVANNYSSYLAFFIIESNGGGTERMRISSSGNVGIGTTIPTSKLQVVGLPVYADNTAATTGGLTAGAFYRTSTGVLMVVF